ncbi:MAG TPA: hypothetical protein VFA00_07455, partial [Actinomycetota bacterium]|nr:hypothetical protein [Actinomycetota bacterium]
MGNGGDGRLGRRAFLGGAAAAGFTAITAPARARPTLWSDPATWGGNAPGRDDIVRIDRPVVLDRDVVVGGVVVGPEG